MWYTDTDKQELDFTKPICATSCDGGSTYLLLPTNQDKSYNFRGYNWFNTKTGEWNSCKDWETVEEAIKPYNNVRNCDIGINYKD